MRKIIYSFLILVIFTTFAFSQNKRLVKTKLTKSQKLELKREKFDPKRNPNDDLQTAIIRATAENKRIIIDIGGEWCGWCIQMDNYFLQHKDLAKLRDKNFIWVKVNMSEGNENKEFLGKYPKISGYPHLYVLEKDGSVLHSQNTSDIEEPDLPIVVPSDVKDKQAFLKKEQERRKQRSYDLTKFTEFLKRWTLAQTTK